MSDPYAIKTADGTPVMSIFDAAFDASERRFTAADLEQARAEARAVAFDDAAAIVRSQHKHGTKCETEEEWLQASYTFSNEAVRVRKAAGLSQPERAE